MRLASGLDPQLPQEMRVSRPRRAVGEGVARHPTNSLKKDNMKKALLLLTAVLATSLLGFAQDRPRWEIFGGYAYGRLDIHDAQNALNLATNAAGLAPLNLGDHLNSNGWDLSLQQNPADWFGLMFDIGATYNKKDVNLAPDFSLPPGTTEVIRLKPSFYTFTGGPQFTYRKNSHYQPFGRVLLGLAYGRAERKRAHEWSAPSAIGSNRASEHLRLHRGWRA